MLNYAMHSEHDKFTIYAAENKTLTRHHDTFIQDILNLS